jgi:twitching motility protein PilI
MSDYLSKTGQFGALRAGGQSMADYQREIYDKINERNRYVSEHMGEDERMYVGARVAGRSFLFDCGEIGQVAPRSAVVPMPMGRKHAIGAANIKGSVYTVTDLGVLLGAEPMQDGILVVLSDRVLEGASLLVKELTVLVNENDLPTPGPNTLPNSPDWVRSAFEMQGEKYFLIDVRELAIMPEFATLQATGGNQ